jgi:hypothetical protein
MAGADPRIEPGDGQNGEGVIPVGAEGKGSHQLGTGLWIPFPRCAHC